MAKKERRATKKAAAPSRPLRLAYPADLHRNLARAFQSAEERRDHLESEAFLADGRPLPAGEFWRRFGL